MADGILAAVNENGNIDRFIDTKGGVHYIEPKRYEESVAKIDAAAIKAKETVNSATEAVSECKAQTGACTQETARAKEIADTVESRITGIEGDIATLRDSVSQAEYFASSSSEFSFTPKVSGVIVAQVWAYETFPAYGGQIRIHIATPAGLRSVAEISTGMVGNDRVMRMITAKAVFAGVEAGKTYNFRSYNDPDAGFGQSTPRSWLLEVRPY